MVDEPAMVKPPAMVDEPARVEPPAMVDEPAEPAEEPAPVPEDEAVTLVPPPREPPLVTASATTPEEPVHGEEERSETRLPPPAIIRLLVTAGPLEGGTRVVIEGAGFVEGCQVKIDRVPVSTAFTSSTEIAFTTPARNVVGRVDVDVANPDGQWTTVPRGLEYCTAPTLTGITPDRAPETGGVRATLSGSALREGSEVRIGAARPQVEYCGPTRLDLLIGSHPAGTYDVELTGPDGQEARLPGAFHFQGPPRIDGIVPDHGPFDAATSIVIEGDGFRTGCSVYLDRERLPAELQSGARLVATAPPRKDPGAVAVRVINVDGLDAERADAFRYDGPPGPHITEIDPAYGTRGVEHEVVVTGERFSDRCSVRVAGAPVPTRFVSAGRLEVTVPPIDRLGFVDVEVRGVDQSHVLEGAFEVRAPAPPPPIIRSVSPNRVGIHGGSEVTIEGDNFAQGFSVLVAGVPVGSASVRGKSTIVFKTPAGEAGSMVDVVVRSPSGAQAVAKRAFLYDPRYG